MVLHWNLSAGAGWQPRGGIVLNGLFVAENVVKFPLIASVDDRDSPSGSWLVCLLLAASLWRGPLPWIHRHVSAPADLADGSMDWHLEHFHNGRAAHAGWHVHLTFPWDVFDPPARENNPDGPRPTSDYEMPFVVTSALADADAGADASPSPPATVPLAATADGTTLPFNATSFAGLTFLQTYSPAVSLRALICVARC